MQISPLRLEIGYDARTSFDWFPPQQPPTSAQELLSREQANVHLHSFENIWASARQHLQIAQAAQSIQANCHRREPDFTVDDLVYVSTAHWKTGRPQTI